MSPEEFRRHAHALVDWLADYLATLPSRPVLPGVAPGDIRRALPAAAPDEAEPFEAILADLDAIVVPGLTLWNHPGFLGYFPVGSSGAGALADFASAVFSQQAMLWRTSPVATELEEVVLGWLRDALGLSPAFEGVIYDGASTATLHALAAARDARLADARRRGLAGRPDVGPVRVYCSEHAHSSVDKAMIVLGLGQDALTRLPADAEFRLDPPTLLDAVERDRAAGVTPIAVVATVGTTSSSSIDPVPAIAAICRRRDLWLHVDSAYAGVAALLPECRWVVDGFDQADSVVVNPHKWLFTPFDLTAFYCRRMDAIRATFALTPDYLRSGEGGAVRNLMDTGFQLGRRFRALKLWFVMRAFGLAGLRARLAEHMRLARLFGAWVDADPDFARVGPVPLSVVCFRAAHRSDQRDESWHDRLNERLMDAVNATGEIFLTHTRLGGRLVLRVAIGNLRTTEATLARAWQLLREHGARLAVELP